MTHFKDRGLSFPLPSFLLEAFAEIGVAFTRMCLNFLRYFLALWIRAQEEGIKFGLEELRQLYTVKNKRLPGTMLLSPHNGHAIIEGIPNRDVRWREKFFVFKVNSALVGDFVFDQIPRDWSKDIDSLY